MIEKLKDPTSDWLFIVPIRGLLLTKEVNNELKVGNVLFVSKERLPRIRKRLGIPLVISKLGKIGIDNPESLERRINDFFKSSKTFAITHFSGTPKNNEIQNIRKIEKAINLVPFSKLGYSTRNFKQKIEIKSSDKILYNEKIYIDKNNKRLSINFNSLHTIPLELNSTWKKFQRRFFYFQLLKIVNGEQKIKRKWKNTLISTANLIGKSINSHDIPEAFLRNVIAMEMLLVNQNEKIKEKLIERSAYLLEWYKDWSENKLPEKIEALYKKRCDFVHDGDTENISKEDLIFSDDLLFNLINNIFRNIDKIDSKGSLIDFSNKYQCEKKLGLKSKLQFGRFEYMKKEYRDLDIENL